MQTSMSCTRLAWNTPWACTAIRCRLLSDSAAAGNHHAAGGRPPPPQKAADGLTRCVTATRAVRPPARPSPLPPSGPERLVVAGTGRAPKTLRTATDPTGLPLAVLAQVPLVLRGLARLDWTTDAFLQRALAGFVRCLVEATAARAPFALDAPEEMPLIALAEGLVPLSSADDARCVHRSGKGSSDSDGLTRIGQGDRRTTFGGLVGPGR